MFANLGRVLAIYASAAFAVLQVVDIFLDRLDLPDWFFSGVVTLLVIGLPIVVMTSIVQSRDFKSKLIEQNFTWKRAIAGGVLAFAVLTLSGAGYAVSRHYGVGPGASLVSTGTLSNEDRLIIAEFDGPPEDPALATMFSEAVRMSLARSDKVKPVTTDEVREELGRMKLAKTTTLTRDVAKEVAVRFGAKAIVNGRLTRVGDSYIAELSLVSVANGEPMTAFRETAKSADKLIETIDNLSRNVRKRIGDSLNKVRADPPLAKATTSSLDALKKYTLGVRASAAEGDFDKSIRLYDEAIALDSTFASAYLAASISLTNRNDPISVTRKYLREGYPYIGRLTAAERLKYDSFYVWTVNGDVAKAIELRWRMFEDGDSTNATLANNAGHAYLMDGQFAEGARLLRIAVARSMRARNPIYQPFSNLSETELELGNANAADSAAELLNKYMPNHPRYARVKSVIAVNREQYDSALFWSRKLAAASQFALRSEGQYRVAMVQLLKGRVTEGIRTLRENVITEAERKQPATVLLARAHLAQALAVSGQRDEARAELQSALSAIPLSSIEPVDRPYDALQCAWELIGDKANVQALATDMTRGWDLMISRADSVPVAARAALAAGDAKHALVVTSDISHMKTSAHVQVVRGRAFEMLSQNDSAIARYESYVGRTSNSRMDHAPFYLGDTYERLGGLYEKKGDIANARKYYAKLVDLWGNGEGEMRQRSRLAADRLALLAER